MKKFTLLLAVLCTALIQAQENFPYQRPELLINKEVTVKTMNPNVEEAFGGYENFYSDKDPYSGSTYKENSKRRTSSSSLANRTFKVVSSEFDSSTPFPYHIFKLEDKETKELVYYKYNLKSARTDIYPFVVVGGLDVPDDFYCDYIEEVEITTPSYFVECTGIYKLEKDVEKGKAKYSLILQTDDMPIVEDGIVITLENNTTITRPKSPIVRGRRTLGSFEPTLKELELLKNNRITGFTLGKAKGLIIEGEMLILKNSIKCLMSK